MSTISDTSSSASPTEARDVIALTPAEFWELVARVRKLHEVRLATLRAQTTAAEQLREAQVAIVACLDRLAVTYPDVPREAFELNEDDCTIMKPPKHADA